MSNIIDNQILSLMMKMERVAESNQKLADAIAAQTMALHALAASNEEIVTVLASVAVDVDDGDGEGDGGMAATSLDQRIPERPAATL
jgi:hypothetical protein